MAEQDRTVDITRPLSELAADEELAGIFGDMGFDVTSSRTVPELAEEAGVDLSIVGMALSAAGYEVEGYEPTEDAKNSPLEALVQELSHAEPLGMGASSVDPMVLNMEYAIQRAQRDGTLPPDSSDAPTGGTE